MTSPQQQLAEAAKRITGAQLAQQQAATAVAASLPAKPAIPASQQPPGEPQAGQQ